MSDSIASRPRILIADDSDVCRTVLAILLKNTGFDVTSVVNGREALAKMREQAFDLAVLDNDMPVLDGLGTLVALRAFLPDLPVAVVSGTLSDELRSAYKNQRISAIYDKPVDPRKLRDQIPAILAAKNQKAEAPAIPSTSEKEGPFLAVGKADTALEKPVFAGESPQVRKLVGNFVRIRDFRSAATISGPPGSAFLDVAVALAEEMDAVLLACSAAKVSQANLAALLEPALLRARPVLLIVLEAEKLAATQQELIEDLLSGGGSLSPFNGRAKVILCAQASLEDLADSGVFNEMLLMRAGGMKLHLPPLTQRLDDLPHVASAVLRRIGAASVKLSAPAELWLEAVPWPHDYLQLHRAIEIAHRNHPGSSNLDIGQLETAAASEPTWNQPLYHDMLLQSLSGK